MSTCSICKGPLAVPLHPATQDCGGDCLRCMADVAEDPDCVHTMNRIRKDQIERAIDVVLLYGGHDGAHHKDWVIDQVVRILADVHYDTVVANAKAGEDGPETYSWNVGIAP